MRILFVAMPDSIHTARWIGQLDGLGWDIHLFPIPYLERGAQPHPGMKNLTLHDVLYDRPLTLDPSVRTVDDYWPWGGWPLPFGKHRVRRFMQWRNPAWRDRTWRLAQTIRKLQPDIVHSLEIQHAGYATLEARRQLDRRFPTWIVTNWGSDIYLFGRLPEHIESIKAVLAACDYYSCECARDVPLAHNLGLKGETLPVLPNTGGFDLDRIAQFQQPGSTSQRRLIVLKGYQGWAGRALVGLRAIALCASELKGYRVAIYLAGEDVKLAAQLLTQATGIPTEIIPPCSHDDMLRLFGRARAYIGLSISDAISTSLLEAMVMGAFPIQSCTSCAGEWIADGQTGLIVPPEDPEPVAAALRRALTEDGLVDHAAAANATVAAHRLDRKIIRAQAIAIYKQVAKESEQRTKDSL